ncbi:MAG: two-component sensor histidine kinase [Rhodocyclaceae bacterium]|nr:two-component sensor histidine kinase [Rhodocyclaceae bacterium]
MDGLKKRLNESLQLRLSIVVSLAILVVAIVAGIFSFLSAFDEAHELQDDVLRQVAQLLSQQRLSPPQWTADVRPKGADEEARVIVQPLGETNPSPLGVDEGGTLPLPVTLPEGLQTLMVNGEAFRILVKTTLTGERIAVSQEAGLRNEIARDSALRTVTPFLILVPVLLLLVANLVRKMFRPIAELTKEIDQRAEQALHPVDDRYLPIEVRPFAVAINRLLARVEASMESQRQFVADAAHELRSPLTALSLQAERLEEAEMSSLASERLVVLRQGIDRSRNLLDQLLSFARAQAGTESPKSPISIQGIYRRVLEDLMPLADAKQINIGIEGEQDAEIPVNELDMITLIKNLVDNAIRYTPKGGRIDLVLNIADSEIALRIRDSGAGIPLSERDRVFDPFYRILGSNELGSGLGLSIVKTICTRIGMDIQLAYTDEATQTGLEVCMRMTKPEPVIQSNVAS